MIQQAVLIYVVTVVLTCLTNPVNSLLQSNDFHAVTNCFCPNDVVTYQCTVCGQVIAWEGTALDTCSGREIALTKRDFVDTIVCDDGAIAARIISEESGCFTSRLNITFDVTLQNRTVSCSVDNGTHASEVGIDVLTLSTEPYPPPERVHLAAVTSNELIFSWNQSQNNCPSLRYNILSTNYCGDCPNTTEDTSVNCSDFTISNSITLCTLMVQTVLCGNSGAPLIGKSSDSITVNLTIPTINQVMTVPHYHIDNRLASLTVNFSTLSHFTVYKGINGSAISYTINYLDSDTGITCGSEKINSTLCTAGGFCSTEFDILSSMCTPSDINITVFVTTNLGEGPKTNPIMEEYQNNFVRVQVISLSASINCTFLNVPKEDELLLCNATIMYGENCQDQELIIGTRDSGNVVIVSLRNFLEKTASSKYCGFRVMAIAGAKAISVDGDLFAVSFNNPSNSLDAVIAGVVSFVIILVIAVLLIVLTFSLLYFKRHQRSIDMTDSVALPLDSEDTAKFTIIPVRKKCNMIEFAKNNIKNYDPDSGKGYYQFIKSKYEYISPKTEVVLVSKDEKRTCTGPKAREIIGVRDEREYLTLPDLRRTQWEYVFIQSTSRLTTLLKGTRFMFYGEPNVAEKETAFKDDDEKLSPIEEKYHVQLERVPLGQEYPILDFVKTKIEGVTYNPRLGYGFYEFTKPELISYDKQVIVMDQEDKLHYGPGARCVIGIGPGQSYDEAEEIEPKFDQTKWKCVFIQTRSDIRKLQPDTWFLFCTPHTILNGNVTSFKMIKVLEPSILVTVPEADENERKLIKFAKKNVPYYNPSAGYAYSEFTGRMFVIKERNVMALKKNELFTGPGVRNLIGIAEDYDDTKEIEAPDLSNTEWDCIFIQRKGGYGRVLEPHTRFLYCEYDYNPGI